jgi:hypothetical protein
MPTVISCSNFNARSDAKDLKTALSGSFCDFPTIIEILGTRSGNQRSAIAREFKSIVGLDLPKVLKLVARFLIA